METCVRMEEEREKGGKGRGKATKPEIHKVAIRTVDL